MAKRKASRRQTVEPPADPRDQAISNLQRMIALAISKGHSRSAIASQRELNLLIGLRGPEDNPADDFGAVDDLAECRAHLENLELVADNELDSTPTPELARLAAMKVMQTH